MSQFTNLDKLLQRFVDDGLPGCGIVVAKKGEILYENYFGWAGGSGTWAEADPKEGLSVVYMHNLQPNLEEYHHLRMRACVYGCLD